MISGKNTIFDRALWRVLAAGLLYAASGAALQAQECNLPDARAEADCLRQLVGEMKQDMRTLLDDIEQYKARAEEFARQSKLTEEQFQTVITQKNTIIGKQTEIIGQHEQDMGLAARQIDLYKTCCLGSAKGRLRLHVGVGATGSDTELAGMVGVGLGNFNVYGFIQEQNSGLMLGYQF